MVTIFQVQLKCYSLNRENACVCLLLFCFLNRFGRNKVFMFLSVSGALAVALTGLSNSYVMFIFIRASIGATLFSLNVIGFTLSK